MSISTPVGIGNESPIDVTQVWNRCHAHLQPIQERLPIDPADFAVCPQCGSMRALPIVANVRAGATEWTSRATLLHCDDCRRYSVAGAGSKYDSFETEQLRAAVRTSGAVSAVDARVWTTEPKCLCLEPTTRCNFNCWYCVGRTMKQEDISLDGFHRVLDNYPSIEVLYLVGEGEPLVHKHYFEMVKAAKARGLQVWMLTNGSVFTESVVPKVCESGLDYVSVSVDSLDPKTFSESRVDGKLEQVLEGVERLVRYKREHGFDRPKIGLRGTLFPETHHELPAILAEGARRGFDFIDYFQPLNRKRSYLDIYPLGKRKHVDDRGDVALSILQGYKADVLPPIWGAQAREQLGTAVDHLFGKSGHTPRRSCNERMIHARATGDVIPCCQIKDVMSESWNLLRTPMSSIFEDHQYDNMRFNLYNGFFMKSCDGCYIT